MTEQRNDWPYPIDVTGVYEIERHEHEPWHERLVKFLIRWVFCLLVLTLMLIVGYLYGVIAGC